MSTIETLNNGESGLIHRNKLNTNFTNLNNDKVEKEAGKGLIETTKITKLDGIEPGAEVNVKSDWNSTSGDSEILNKPTIPTKTSDLINDSLLSDIIAGANITIDRADPLNPIISSTGGGGGGGGGDMLKSENLSGLTNYATARSNLGLGNVDNTSDLNKPISTATQTALNGKVTGNIAITGATKTKITYDSKGLVTSGGDATTEDIVDSTNKRYVTDSQLTVIGNTSGVNTGNETALSINNIIKNSTALTTLDNDNYIPITPSVIGGVISYITWANFKTILNGLYQAVLVSGTNIKTVNGTSLLGSGNISISGGGSTIKRILTVGGTIGSTGTNVGPNLVIDGTYTISQINMWYGTAGNGTLTVDINKNGTTLFTTTKPNITGTNKYSINTGTLTTTSLASGDSITIDIDAVPGTPGVDLYIEIIYS